jgi:V/A-type H+-transporting ATPase subunit A
LSQNRADSKRYPAIDTIDSYSKYLEYPEFIEYSKEKLDENWVEIVSEARNILIRGKETEEQINILGDDSVPIDYHITLWKAELIDFVILQQDAFDKIDSSTSLERQEYMLKKIIGVTRSEFNFESFEEVSIYFKTADGAGKECDNNVVYQCNKCRKACRNTADFTEADTDIDYNQQACKDNCKQALAKECTCQSRINGVTVKRLKVIIFEILVQNVT